MRCDGRQGARNRRWNWFLVFCLPLALVVFAKGAVPDKRVSGRSQRQELSMEERLEAEQRLSHLAYWTGPIDGTLDPAFRHALIAFQKVESRPRTGRLTKGELQALRLADRPLPKYAGYAHVEVDLQRQVLFLVNDTDLVTHILPVCTGSGGFYVDHGEVHRARTPRGNFKVLRKINGIRISSLGLLYYPNYIYEGIAIHGSWAMAVYPDSHGCIRIPMFVAKEFSSLVPVGTEVIVF